ncbi:MAG TPA: hypothetical protein VMH24_03915 [Candidatus Sulfotelmatobacter sp.]|nr:hypothetical protein [Candidatus Sulfotelmatobacter sp.]
MLRDLGRRLGRGAEPPSPDPAPDAAVEPAPPQLEVTAYTDTAVLVGHLAFEAVDRLTDALNAADSFLLTEVTTESLDDGSTSLAAVLRVARDDVVAIAASGPRGDPSRRVRTQAQPVTIQSGPYELTGRVHALAGADPIGSLKRRRVMVPLTLAHVAFTVAGRPRFASMELLIINRDLIDAIHGQGEPTTGTAPSA